jgi:hypothetical protein
LINVSGRMKLPNAAVIIAIFVLNGIDGFLYPPHRNAGIVPKHELKYTKTLWVSTYDTNLSYAAEGKTKSRKIGSHDSESEEHDLKIKKNVLKIYAKKHGLANTDGIYESEDHSKGSTSKPKRIANRVAKGIQKEHSYEEALSVLRAFHDKHGNLVIPRRYIVPNTDDFPQKWRGVDLGKSIYTMQWWTKHVKSRPERVSELNKLGFVWERLQTEWNCVLEALIVYYTENGHIRVPSTYVVPFDDDNWPKATWGIALGNCVHRMRTRHDFLRDEDTSYSRREQLDGLGFVWDVSEVAFQKFFSALKHFKNIETKTKSSKSRSKQTIRVPSTYVIPSGVENGWPKDLWGYPLGQKCAAVRQKQIYIKHNPERIKALENIGFNWSGNATLGWLEVVHAAAIYSKLHGKTLDVPAKFVVPSPPETNEDSLLLNIEGAWPWPEKLWGFPLGQRLKDIRLKNAYMTGDSANLRRTQLDALGFNWKPKRGRRRREINVNF